MKKSEFEDTLCNVIDIWSRYSKEQVAELLGEDVGRMVGYNQCNPHHCYDLFQHSLHTVEGLSDEAGSLLKVAAFFHDIGKPDVAKKKDERLVFYGHAGKSAKIVKPILAKMGYSEKEISEIIFYVKHHDDFITWDLKQDVHGRQNQYIQEISLENLQKHIQKVEKKQPEFKIQKEHWINLLLLCKADVSAQADITIQNGKVIETREHKMMKIEALQECLKNI